MEAFTPTLTQMGLPGIVIAGLAFAVWHLWKRINEITDARTADQKEQGEILLKTVQAEHKMADALRALEQILRDRGTHG